MAERVHGGRFGAERAGRRLALGLGLALAAGGPAAAESVLTEWMPTILEEVRETHPDPTAASRFAAVTFTAAYEAWAAYDPVAMGAVTGNVLDGTGGEATDENRAEAIAHAIGHAMPSLAVRWIPTDEAMAELGYAREDGTLPAILGKRIAAALLDTRRTDGANHLHMYQDTTNYMVADPSELSTWQPIIFQDELQEAVTPHWARVTPFALKHAAAFRPPPPPAVGTPAFDAEKEELLQILRDLTLEQRATAEFWIPYDGSPTSHLLELAWELSEERGLTLEQDVKLFFLLSNALFDAGIAAWDAKYHYNYVRPETALERFTPYIDTPAFPEYVSGHSAFTAVWAVAMEGFFGAPDYGYEHRVRFLEALNLPLVPGALLRFETFWDAAESSGASRLYGGVHWPIGNREGLILGRKVGEAVLARAEALFSGQAMPATAAFLYPKEPLWAEMPGGGLKSVLLDPLPAGTYVLNVILSEPGETAFEVMVREDGGEDGVEGGARVTDKRVQRTRPGSFAGENILAVTLRSTGTTPFSIEVRPVEGNARPALALVRAAKRL